MKVSVFTLGCKVNRYESDVIIRELREKGYEVTEELEPADYYIINTCAVTAEAEKKSRQCVARAKKHNPDAKILVCGCASENNAKQFEKNGVVYVTGTAGKDVVSLLPETGINILDIPDEYEENGFAERTRTRAYVKIQDGCNNFCSYCLIPYVRGRSRSRAIGSVVAEVKNRSADVKEIVLTGIDISSYGKDIGCSLKTLAESLSDEDVRIRFGSFEVGVIDEELLNVLTNMKKFCPHFHLSLQSGSDVVLKSMNRRYTTDQYFEKVGLIRKYFPLAGITTDVIVGFPTESDAEFALSCDFIRRVGFSDVHCFPYSPRKGTVAFNKYKPLDALIIDERMRAMLDIKKNLKRDFLEKNVGVSHEVLFEEKDGEYQCGYTENYLKFYAADAVNDEIRKIAAKQLFRDGLK